LHRQAMTFNVEIKNVGKLTDAKIRFAGFTVFAGPNNTGKSFVSKFLYSLFEAMNANHAEVHMDNLLMPVKRSLFGLDWRVTPEDGGPLASLLGSLEDEVNGLQACVKGIGDAEALREIYPRFKNQVERMLEIADKIHQLPEKTAASRGRLNELSDYGEIGTRTGRLYLHKHVAELKDVLSRMDEKQFVVAGIRYKIRQNLIQNFQVPRLSDLRGEEDTPSIVNVENFGEFQFSNGEVEFNIKPSIKFSWVKQLQYWSRVIYLESPVYWKLKSTLEDARDYPEFHVRGDRERLTGVPGYFHDLVRALKHEYTGEIGFPDVYARLTGEDVIGGKIEISESGNWSFQEKSRSFALPVTAMGIASLGILALLIERKVLDEDAFIFIDEPEAHLHPAWQVIMAETLFELSRRGVHVVIATHSVDILKWLEVHVKNNPDDETRIALNQFPPDGDGPDEDFATQMAKIKQELTQPFSDLYLKGL